MKILLTTLTRNKKDQVARSEQTITTEALKIGRGSDCTLHLPDPRVALHHATIHSREDGSYFIEADSGTFSVVGSVERSIRLRPNQRILLGPFEIVVLGPPTGFDLALSLEMVKPLTEGEAGVKSRVRTGLDQTWLSKRLFSWGAAMLVLLAFLVWPVMNAVAPEGRAKVSSQNLTADASWDVGTLSSAHARFGRDCGKCHQEPFVQVKNQACEDCHKTIGWHIPLDNPTAKSVHAAVFPDTRCATCHRDHKGANGLVRTDATLCTDCHRDLTTRHPTSASPNIADFAKDHPAFKLSILQPGRSGKNAIVRVPQEDKKLAVEKSGLKFPHETHLSRKGVRGPQGRVTLDCKNCHTPDETGLRFKPITMKDHCQACHSLEFEPKVTTRQAPHGHVDTVMTSVTEFYAQAALADTPIDVVVESGIRRPGEKLAEGKRQAALAWATGKAGKITRELFEDRVCFACHQISAVPAEGERAATWHVAPVAITQYWLPKSRFPHSKHNTYECSKCHDVINSKVSADIAIPGVNNCQECHGGNEPARDMARGTCETCHGFHTGSHKAGVPPIVPGGVAPKFTSKAGINKAIEAKP